jgi:succinate dehydrogenase hydrophobic anchor subunit
LGFRAMLLLAALLYAVLAAWDVSSRVPHPLRARIDVAFATVLVMLLGVAFVVIGRAR